MTRKTYRELAERIGKTFAEHGNGNTETWELVAIFCDAMKADNPQFDRETFIDAIEAAKTETLTKWNAR